MGGAGAWHFALTFPERFSAALPVAGRPPDARGRRGVPVFAVGSRRDTVVPIEPTVKRIAELNAKGLTAEMVILETPTHYQTAAHVDGLSRAVSWLKALWAR
jgi:pimeloyl-ACP methyl ester carboxylesterase